MSFTKGYIPWNKGKQRTKKELREHLLSHRHISPNNCWEWTMQRKKGYGLVSFRHRKSIRAHRLAAHLFLGFNLKSKKFVLHRCDNPPCINPAHLFIGTNKDNIRDSIEKGRFTRGERQAKAKLTSDNVRKIRNGFFRGKNSAEIARLLNVTPPNIRSILKRETWKHI